MNGNITNLPELHILKLLICMYVGIRLLKDNRTIRLAGSKLSMDLLLEVQKHISLSSSSHMSISEYTRMSKTANSSHSFSYPLICQGQYKQLHTWTYAILVLDDEDVRMKVAPTLTKALGLCISKEKNSYHTKQLTTFARSRLRIHNCPSVSSFQHHN